MHVRHVLLIFTLSLFMFLSLPAQGKWIGARRCSVGFRAHRPLSAVPCETRASLSDLLILATYTRTGVKLSLLCLLAEVLVIGSALSILTGTLHEIRQVNNERSRSLSSPPPMRYR